MLPRKNRVLTAAEFRQGFKSPVRLNTDWASFYLVSLEPEAPTRVGFVVGGVVGNAVTRNRVRRKLREASRIYLAAHPHGFQLTLRVRREARDLDFTTLSQDFATATQKLSGKIQRS